MAIVNTSKPTTTLINSIRVSSTMVNITRITYDPLWSVSVLPWQLLSPWTINNSGFTNSIRAT